MPLPVVLRHSRPERILVVDDLPDNCFLIQTILQVEGYLIDVVNSGAAALAYLDRFCPDLILLDVMMPEMDGYEVTRRIRFNARLPFIPILLITAYEHPSIVKGLDIGADEFLRKPVDCDELVARVRSLLRLKHTVDDRDRIARQREDFVSRLTHDLRAPLIAANHLFSLFQQQALGELTPQMQEAVSTLLRSNQNLLTMVNTLLEVYRYEAGRKTLNLTQVSLTHLVAEVAAELRPLATEKNLPLDWMQSQDAPTTTIFVVGDRLELRRVITNLLDNAIKFTDTGSIQVEIGTCVVLTSPEQLQSQPMAVIQVKDTGVGISAAEQPHLFESFQAGNHRRSGSGLGLHLSRNIIEAHQGQITVDSTPRVGSVFTVYLPLKQ